MNTAAPGPVVSLDAVQGLRLAIADLFQVSDTTLDVPEPGCVRYRGRFLQDPAGCFTELRRRFETYGFTPLAEPLAETVDDLVALTAIPTVVHPTSTNHLINAGLFIATVFSTLYVGATYGDVGGTFSLLNGWPFCLSIMLILGAHEMGHYIAARYHKVPVTLPYFIPLPLAFGTMGAVIRIKGLVNDKRALLDIGAAGPWAGLFFAVPILLYGLATSPIIQLPSTPYPAEGNSLLYSAMKIIIFGRFLPAGGIDVQLNQVAWAGWAGLLVTSINLIPLGQLDGGHVAYVLFGDKAKLLFWPIMIAMAALMIFTLTPTWILLFALLFFFGRTYAEPLNQVTGLDLKRKIIAALTLLLFVLLFIPVPLRMVTP